MVEAITFLKAHARILQQQATNQEPVALARMRILEELHGLDAAAVTTKIQRRHCLTVVAWELGFNDWPHALAVLSGPAVDDFGTLLYAPGCEVHWNIWSASYSEAHVIREQHGGYLLAYRRHFFIVDRFFIATLRLDPDDPDWERIGRDWVRPKEPAARQRLYAQLIHERIAPRLFAGQH